MSGTLTFTILIFGAQRFLSITMEIFRKVFHRGEVFEEIFLESFEGRILL
jgi:hypothetical protein